jgi:hypothetical protein
MKNLRVLTLIVFCTAAIFNSSSCISVKKDNGKHKGWFKNPNNPHHPLTTNPGHTKTPGNGNSNKGKGKK